MKHNLLPPSMDKNNTNKYIYIYICAQVTNACRSYADDEYGLVPEQTPRCEGPSSTISCEERVASSHACKVHHTCNVFKIISQLENIKYCHIIIIPRLRCIFVQYILGAHDSKTKEKNRQLNLNTWIMYSMDYCSGQQ